MFTGLIQQIGRIQSVQRRGNGLRITIAHAPWTPPLGLGESVAVQGACLTVAERGADWFACDVLGETLSKTDLGRKVAGDRLNLERALRADDRLGGHFVTGHIDGIGRLAARRRTGEDWMLEIEAPPDVLAGLVPKGSVAVNGVSLTVAELGARSFTVSLIPFTWSQTTLSDLREGDAVNLETDVIGKHVRRVLGASVGGGLTEERLRQAGYFRGA